MKKSICFAPWWRGLKPELWTAEAEAHAQRQGYLFTFNEPSAEPPTLEAWQDLYAGAEVIITSWGVPSLDEDRLAKNTDLKLVAHAAGSVANIVSDHLWERGVRVLTLTILLWRVKWLNGA